ncbi:MAG: heme NO-binding domain-containing protein [Planctomycetota bacterium]
MYGLVNKGLERYIEQECGNEHSKAIVGAALGDVGTFVGMQSYDDSIMIDMLTRYCEVAERRPEDALEGFGRFWISYVIDEGYGDLLSATGDTLEELLESLDTMHTRLGRSFPSMAPPSFTLERQEDGDFHLHYRSSRSGFAPFVLGLIVGLCDMLNEQAVVTLAEARDQGADHDVFLIQIVKGATLPRSTAHGT